MLKRRSSDAALNAQTTPDLGGRSGPTSVPVDTADRVFKELNTTVNIDAMAQLPRDQVLEELESGIANIAGEQRLNLTAKEQRELARQFADEVTGAGPLQSLLDDDRVSDIMVNGPKTVFVEIRGKLVKTDVRFRDEQHLRQLAQRIARSVGRRLNESNPTVDARLKDGSRVNIVMPPVSLIGTVMSIRRFPNSPITLDQMNQTGTLDKGMRSFLELAARARLNIIISGGTGSGKTTLLNACSAFIGSEERIVTIEDAAELRLQQPHIISLETRPATTEGAHEITQRELVKNALRMRPDRIILGEIRAGEAFDMLQAMNTGHDGSMSTMHANTPRDAIARLENMILMAGYDLPIRAIRTQIVSAIDIIVQVERMPDGQRRIVNICEVCGMEGDTLALHDLFNFEVTESKAGRIVGSFKNTNATPRSIMDKLSRFGLQTQMKAIFNG